ncbi:hypothetical protein KSP40_PGU019646 [Platanthera guangdongensis]|uniref:Uncharacterized protein n=1 Tax=Platanthera guangdongensis TaxID=2320717 RepID=A0ABR2MLU0_9ASPA
MDNYYKTQLEGNNRIFLQMLDAEERIYELEARQNASEDHLYRFGQVVGTVGEAARLEDHLRKGTDHLRRPSFKPFRPAASIISKIIKVAMAGRTVEPLVVAE